VTGRVQTAEELPAVLPIFPLAGALLLPGCRLPLNIFEPRYLDMTRDALASHRLIAMVQPTDPRARDPRPEVYRTACAGRIAEHRDTPDGRILIALSGIARFAIAEELDVTTRYRQVKADWSAYPGDFGAPPSGDGEIDRQRLLQAITAYLKHCNIPADRQAIEGAPSDALVNSLAMICPFQPPEKQALLEARDIAERCRLMLALMEMAVLQAHGGAPGSSRPQ